MDKNKIILPIVVAAAIIFGVFLGNLLSSRPSQNPFVYNEGSSNGKIDMLLNLIDRQYVDTISMDSLEESVIPKILSDLDPHSSYIPKEELQIVNDDLSGSFSGIGVQFNIQQDTVVIVQVINGGPSEHIGIQPGDRIVEVDDSSFVGKSINNDKVVKRLRGPKGTKVKVGVKRTGADEILRFTITRGDVPTNSVDVAYMLDKQVGYVKVSKFGATTYEEFYDALASLKRQGANAFVVDLRENSGGYLDAAINMINLLLHRNELIVYTQGKAQERADAIADGKGYFQEEPLAVLIDEWSASASEIFSGAIQDNDRGWVIGRRSFGKGLVQQQIPLRDGSAVRLTIARYYTPSGRCIQKPYTNKEDYEMEVYKRYESGELDSDSAQAVTDTVKYYTKNGRVVYGGGGITPDIIIPRDTLGVTKYYTRLHNSASLYEYSFRYTDEHRDQLKSFGSVEDLAAYLDKVDLCDGVVTYAQKKGIELGKTPLMADTRTRINRLVKAYIIRNFFGDNGFYPVFNESDVVIETAVKKLNDQLR